MQIEAFWIPPDFNGLLKNSKLNNSIQKNYKQNLKNEAINSPVIQLTFPVIQLTSNLFKSVQKNRKV